MVAHSKSCSYCDAARSQDISCDMPLFMMPFHESGYSLYVLTAVHTACMKGGEKDRPPGGGQAVKARAQESAGFVVHPSEAYSSRARCGYSA